MSLWKITNDAINTAAMLVAADASQGNPAFWMQFEGNGQPLTWTTRPTLKVFKDKRSKQPKPRADISPFTADGLVLSAKAREALGDFLVPFGQLLELDVDGQTEYYFNVTQVIACVDEERSERRPSGVIAKPVFDETAIPASATVFIDLRLPGDIYVNDAAKAELEQRIAQAGITGMRFVSV